MQKHLLLPSEIREMAGGELLSNEQLIGRLKTALIYATGEEFE